MKLTKNINFRNFNIKKPKKKIANLLKDLLNEARGKFCSVDDLSVIILVGGGSQIPLIKEWIRK